MLRCTRDDWLEKILNISWEDLLELSINPEERRVLGEDTEQKHIAEHKLAWDRRNPAATRDQWEKSKKEEIKAFCYDARNPQKSKPMHLMKTFVHCALHAKLIGSVREKQSVSVFLTRDTCRASAVDLFSQPYPGTSPNFLIQHNKKESPFCNQ